MRDTRRHRYDGKFQSRSSLRLLEISSWSCKFEAILMGSCWLIQSCEAYDDGAYKLFIRQSEHLLRKGLEAPMLYRAETHFMLSTITDLDNFVEHAEAALEQYRRLLAKKPEIVNRQKAYELAQDQVRWAREQAELKLARSNPPYLAITNLPNTEAGDHGLKNNLSVLGATSKPFEKAQKKDQSDEFRIVLDQASIPHVKDHVAGGIEMTNVNAAVHLPLIQITRVWSGGPTQDSAFFFFLVDYENPESFYCGNIPLVQFINSLFRSSAYFHRATVHQHEPQSLQKRVRISNIRSVREIFDNSDEEHGAIHEAIKRWW